MSDDTKVKVVGLTKKFGDLLVLNDISFNVKKGDLEHWESSCSKKPCQQIKIKYKN